MPFNLWTGLMAIPPRTLLPKIPMTLLSIGAAIIVQKISVNLPAIDVGITLFERKVVTVSYLWFCTWINSIATPLRKCEVFIKATWDLCWCLDSFISWIQIFVIWKTVTPRRALGLVTMLALLHFIAFESLSPCDQNNSRYSKFCFLRNISFTCEDWSSAHTHRDANNIEKMHQTDWQKHFHSVNPKECVLALLGFMRFGEPSVGCL